MIVRDQENYLEINLVEIDGPPAGCGDGHFQVKLSAHGFSGENFVWIEAAELHGFVEALAALDPTSKGAVMLESMSPHELKLVVRALEKTGELAVEGELRRNVFIHSRRRRVENRLVFVLDLDEAGLKQAVEGFAAIRREFPLPGA
jgi:hypothetical protein